MANGRRLKRCFFLLFSKTNYPHLKTAYQLSRFSIIVKMLLPFQKIVYSHSKFLQIRISPFMSLSLSLSLSRSKHSARRTFSFSLSFSFFTLPSKKNMSSGLSILNDFVQLLRTRSKIVGKINIACFRNYAQKYSIYLLKLTLTFILDR